MTTHSPSDPAQVTTFAHEDGLPRVPLPTVDQSCERFLQWCTPLLTAEELAETKRAVDEFRAPDSPAHTLHAALEEFDRQPDTYSWLDEFWRSRYLGRRDRIALNANFFFLFADTNVPTRRPEPEGAGDQPQVERAAALIAGAVHYKVRLDAEQIPPAEQRGKPQSMDQVKYLFSTTRIPGEVQDTVRAPYSEDEPGPSQARHILVFHRGNMFSLDVYGPDGTPHSLADLHAGLESVIKSAAEPGEYPAGHLTTKARAEWAASRAALIDTGNRDALDVVETALFCVALEDFEAPDTQLACDTLLHGDRGNRWFDKSLTFVVFADGRAGFNGEHCGLDGTTVLSFLDDVLTSTPAEHSAGAGAEDQGTPSVRPVEFELTDALRADIAAARDDFAAYAEATASECVRIKGFGSNQIKQLKVSPDAFVQMAFQLAHRRSKGMTGATYESIATRHWKRGRTEAMRVVTPEILDFVAAMDDSDASADDRRTAFRAAADAHVARAKACQAGEAPEQHLWELEWIQRRRGEELDATEPLALYDSPGWRIMRDDYMSTSAVPSVNVLHFGFGMTSQKCIGVAYGLLPDWFNIYLATPRAVEQQMYDFAAELKSALTELHDLLS